MNYISTRGQKDGLSASRVIIKGIADDGGLYVPEKIPVLTKHEFDALIGKSYGETAKFVLGKFLGDFSKAEIEQCVAGAYTAQSFEGGEAPIVELDGDTGVLELWHGPTCAFKDMALQLMPRLLVTSLAKNEVKGKAVVLVATSGDTGKAALEGFRDVGAVEIAVLFPDEGVSAVQKRQMTTQLGGNVAVAAVRGNFDDAQNTVKSIFADVNFNQKLAEKNMFLTSANSINWGRLVPQIIYYFYACAQVKARGLLEQNYSDGFVDICVPTGNFGNILACFYAKKMGAPIGKLICASNSNNVLTDFIKSGVYDRNRDFIKTSSPSMDILISSNLERLLFELSGHDGAYIAELMDSLAKDGRYIVSDEIKRQLSEMFTAGFCDDTGTQKEINRVWKERGYLLDTHTAVASDVLHACRERQNSGRYAVLVSTASPYKFASDVLSALGAELPESELGSVEALSAVTGQPIPKGLRGLAELPVVHGDVLDSCEARQWLSDKLKAPR